MTRVYKGATLGGWTSRRWCWIVVLTSAAVFILSLTQTAFVADVDYDWGSEKLLGFYGWELLIVGLGGALERLNLLVWSLVVGAWLAACQKRYLAAAIAGLGDIGLMSISPDTNYAAWLANPIIVVGWFLYLRHMRITALISASMALALALSFLPAEGIPAGRKLEVVPIISYAIGYWLWIASAAVLAVGVYIDAIISSRAAIRRLMSRQRSM